MHPAVIDFVSTHRPAFAGDVLDVGGRDVNGSPAALFADAESYTTVDLVDGPGVDIVGDVCNLGLVEVADVALCLEVLEHAPDWPAVVAACADALRTGGTLIVTCAGPGRAPHSASDGGALRPGEHYRNVSADELFEALVSAGLTVDVCQEVGSDTQATARRL